MAALLTVNTELMQYPALPAHAMLTLNRCNLPAVVLGSVAFQLAPQPLWLDGVMELHRAFFQSLHAFDKAESRASCFRDYMSSCFLLDHLDQAGLNHQGNVCRPKADFLRTLRGWMFDADSQEAAVLKGWAESRFGLLPRYHQGPLGDYHSESWLRFQALRARGLYNTNALEAQLDVLYAWCQYELKRRFPGQSHWTLFRGINHWQQHDVMPPEIRAENSRDRQQALVLLNNLNSFSSEKDYADAFGDQLIKVDVPLVKLLYFPGLLPGVLPGEQEYLVIGGLYQVTLLRG